MSVSQTREGKSDNTELLCPCSCCMVMPEWWVRKRGLLWMATCATTPTESWSSSFRNHEMLLESQRSNSNICRCYKTIKGHLLGLIGKFNRPILNLQGRPRQYFHFACHFAIFPIGYFNSTVFCHPITYLPTKSLVFSFQALLRPSGSRQLRVNWIEVQVAQCCEFLYFDHNRQINQCANRVLWSTTTRNFLCGNDAAKNGAQVGIVVRVRKDVQVLARFRRCCPFTRGPLRACPGFRCRRWWWWRCKCQWQ